MPDQKITLSDFDYNLPESLIAQKPAEPRDHSRLLVYRRDEKSITDDFFYNIASYLPHGSALVVNNSRVEKSRLLFGNREVFVTRVIDSHTVEAMIRPGKAFKTGKTVTLSDDTNHPISADVLEITEDGLRILRFNHPVDDPVFDPWRRTPFPPYISPDENLSERYQTVYARDAGSKAAPTAGLHFTDRTFAELKKKSIHQVEITLHVGMGTFAPVKTEQISDHKMHSEWYHIPKGAAEKLRTSSHITAVGTTSARVLESIASGSHDTTGVTLQHDLPFRYFTETRGETNIFITPGYQFRAVDALLTNFHLPRSTLLMMIAAFTGLPEMHRIYKHAIDNQYRFYSFGDAMLVL